MSLWNEFKAFAVKGNVIDLAVAFVIGAAFSKIVNALVEGIVMPLIGKALPSLSWKTYEVGGVQVGALLGAVIDFFIVALVLFLVVVKVMGTVKKMRHEDPPDPTTKKCTECLEEIPLLARRCRACASEQPS
jgi:large conductance mechanosensitive channel